jgi:hypothetical protein
MGVSIGFETVGGTRQAGWLAGLALEAFLIWRVWRGGVLAWAVAGLVLLASPAIRTRTTLAQRPVAGRH